MFFVYAREGERERETDMQACRHANIQTDRHTDIHTHRDTETCMHADRQTDMGTGLKMKSMGGRPV